MRIAIISDIHGNYPALEKVIEDAHSNNVEQFVFLGDYIFDLPYSNEVTRLIRDTKPAFAIKGNKEACLDRLIGADQSKWAHEQMGALYQSFLELESGVLAYLLNLQDELYVPLDDGGALFAAHYLKNAYHRGMQHFGSREFHRKMRSTPFTHEQYLADFQRMLERDEVKAEIDAIDASVIAYGHHHLQAYGHCGGKLVINPGSCGQPLDFNQDAAYSILSTEGGKYRVEERRVRYDVTSLISKARASSLYKKGRIWSELVFLALKTGRDYYGVVFEIARRVAESKGEKDPIFSNGTWAEAYEIFINHRKEYGF